MPILEYRWNPLDSLVIARLKASTTTAICILYALAMAPSDNIVLLISYTSLKSALFGIGFALYCVCVRVWYGDYQAHCDRRKKTCFLIVYTSLIVMCAFISVAASSIQAIGAEASDQVDDHASQTAPTPILLSYACETVYVGLTAPIQALADMDLNSGPKIWRVWVVWTGSPYANLVIIGVLMIWITKVVLWIATVASTSPRDWLTFVSFSRSPRLIAFDALFTAFNILVTLLITGRLLYARRRLSKLIGEAAGYSKQYTNIVVILIESYAVAACLYLVDMISRLLESPHAIRVSIIMGAITGLVELIAYLFVMYRVLQGRAWERSTDRQLSTLRFQFVDGESSVSS
ncbi:hypothetical protein NP233_g1110 [Leucocoprinus birnbaumii]|uniref:Transmembrane protein n=1 Tax=Leucocoprinus birnbaumii TaxID=56174 RepID=A0AAD5W4L6_9AGAR|nr:hypothetical protein NP233_g1110 [Leucocoprinus birnbaumii]